MHHFVQGRSDQAGQPDDVALLLLGHLQDLLCRHHHAQVDHVIAVATEHHADDILADVVDVALDRGHEDLALGFARSDEHTSDLPSLLRISYAVFCLKNKTNKIHKSILDI